MKKLIALIASISLLGSTLICRGEEIEVDKICLVSLEFDNEYNINIRCYYAEKDGVDWFESYTKKITVDTNNIFTDDGMPYYFLKQEGKIAYAINLNDYNFIETINEKSRISKGENKAYIAENDLENWEEIKWAPKNTKIYINPQLKTLITKENVEKAKDALKKFDEKGKIYRLIFFTEDGHTPQFFEYLRVKDEKNLKQEIEKQYKVAVLHIQKPETKPQFPNILIKTFDNTNVKKEIGKVDPNAPDYKTCITEYLEKQRAIAENADRILSEFAGALSATLKS